LGISPKVGYPYFDWRISSGIIKDDGIVIAEDAAGEGVFLKFKAIKCQSVRNAFTQNNGKNPLKLKPGRGLIY